MRTIQLALIIASLMVIGTAMAQNEPSDGLQEMPSENGAMQGRRDNRAEHRSNYAEQRSQRRDNRVEHRGRAQTISARTPRSRR